MICDCCRRDVDYVRESFWHGDARICRECFAQWYRPDDDQVGSADPMSVGNYVRLRHGLPTLAAAIAILVLSGTTTTYASRHCLDHADAAQAWPARTLLQDGDGCWSASLLAPRGEVPDAMPQTVVANGGPLRSEALTSGPLVTMSQFALFVAVVMVTMPGLAAWRHEGSDRPRRAPARAHSW